MDAAVTITIPQSSEALRRARSGERLAIVGRHGKTRLLLDLARDLEDAVFLRVPSGPDQVPYLLLQTAAAHGSTALRDIASHLGRSVESAVSCLDEIVGPRPLLVDDIDAIGVRGIDPELRFALASSFKSLRTFFDRNAKVVSLTTQPRNASFGTIAPEPAVAKGRALWERVDHDTEAFQIAIAREHLAPLDQSDEARSWHPAEMVADLWYAIPEILQEVVALLAVHGRPIATADLEALSLVERSAIREAITSGIAIEEQGTVWLPKPWYTSCPVVLNEVRSRAIHLKLAQAFSGQVLDGDAHLVKPLLVLEAHRHFAAVPDLERAQKFAHFGASTLLDAARNLSLDGRADERYYAEAAKTYGIVLSLQKDITHNGGSLGETVEGYATHYQHYNRYKAKLESMVETIDGYRRALALWPENALFNSRTVVALFLDERYPEALRELAEAFQRVPAHPKRESHLRARTTEKLLRRDRVEAAILAWHDFHATPSQVFHEQLLFDRIRSGFTSRRLRGAATSIVLFEPVHVRFSKTSAHWMAHALDSTGHGEYPAAAYENLIASLRDETRLLHQTLTHRLSAPERMRKQRLLGQVDLAASGLLERGDGTTWVYGRIAERDGQIAFVTENEEVYVLGPDLSLGATKESGFRLACVRTGEAGEPVGPVIALESPLGEDPDAAFEQWRQRLAEDG